MIKWNPRIVWYDYVAAVIWGGAILSNIWTIADTDVSWIDKIFVAGGIYGLSYFWETVYCKFRFKRELIRFYKDNYNKF